MTNKERAKVYRKAAICVFEHHFFCCGGINSSIPRGGLSTHEICQRFPEFNLFRQPSIAWWQEEDYESRILALLLCEQIALNP